MKVIAAAALLVLSVDAFGPIAVSKARSIAASASSSTSIKVSNLDRIDEVMDQIDTPEDINIKSSPRWRKKTKQLATLGPASSSFEMIEKLFLAGADVFRLNFSHGEHAQKKELLDIIRSVEAKYDHPIAILGDLQGPKLRVSSHIMCQYFMLYAYKYICLLTFADMKILPQIGWTICQRRRRDVGSWTNLPFRSR